MLPAPTAEAYDHSQRVVAHLYTLIDRAGGWIPFARYMEAALYAPGLGYYAAGATKLGAGGDFTTAPEMTPLFGRTVARALAPVIEQTGGDLLELGAGSGQLAVDVLGELARIDALPGRYAILEVSADLRARQQALLAQARPDLLGHVEWLDTLPTGFSGVILANEVLDALPVDVVVSADPGPLLRGVTVGEAGFEWHDRPLDETDLHDRVSALALPPGYLIEINRAAAALVDGLAQSLSRGLIVLIDYGFGAGEYYHPQRHMGTLRAHYRHHALDDPFYLPGLCDLTAHVDFSAVANAATQAGLTLAGYTSQAHFLINAGLTDLLAEYSPADPAVYLPQANAVQRLVSPAEMGDLFKVMALIKGDVDPLAAFARGDRCHAL